MISAVEGIFVFFAAVCTHREASHSGLISIVGEVFDDRVSGATVCTVDKRIAVASVLGRHHFLFAVLADGDVRRYEHKTFARFGFFDDKISVVVELG